MQPLISIIVPAYNSAAFLPQCLDSLKDQSYRNLEFICINDGSIDGSLELLKEYAAADSRFVIIDQPNKGLSESRNAGINMAKGEYMMFVDSDDWIDTATCSIAMEAANNHDTRTVLWTYWKEYVDGKSQKVEIFDSPKYFDRKSIRNLWLRIIGPGVEDLATPQFIDSLSTAWGRIYDAEIIRRNRLKFIDTKEIGTEDLLFNVEYFKLCDSAIILTDALTHYRKYATTSLTNIHKADLPRKWQNLYRRITGIIGDDREAAMRLDNRRCCSIIGLGLNEVFSEHPRKEVTTELEAILSDKDYRSAFRQLDMSAMPLHWRLFFTSTKEGHYTLLYFLLRCIEKIIR